MATETKSRKNQTVRDLVLSMLVVGGFVAFLYIIVIRPTPDPVRVVDAIAAPAAVARTCQRLPGARAGRRAVRAGGRPVRGMSQAGPRGTGELVQRLHHA